VLDSQPVQTYCTPHLVNPCRQAGMNGKLVMRGVNAPVNADSNAAPATVIEQNPDPRSQPAA